METITFGSLRMDEKFISCVQRLQESLEKVEASINDVMECHNNYDELSVEDKIKYDNYKVYTLNSLYWIYLKIKGIDCKQYDVKNELSRVRQTILRDKQIHEYKTMRPVLDKAAAGRFIKSGLKRFRNEEEETAIIPHKNAKTVL